MGAAHGPAQTKVSDRTLSATLDDPTVREAPSQIAFEDLGRDDCHQDNYEVPLRNLPLTLRHNVAQEAVGCAALSRAHHVNVEDLVILVCEDERSQKPLRWEVSRDCAGDYLARWCIAPM